MYMFVISVVHCAQCFCPIWLVYSYQACWCIVQKFLCKVITEQNHKKGFSNIHKRQKLFSHGTFFKACTSWISQASLVSTRHSLCQIRPLRFLKSKFRENLAHMKCFSREDLMHMYQKQLNGKAVIWLLHHSPHQSGQKLKVHQVSSTVRDLWCPYWLC